MTDIEFAIIGGGVIGRSIAHALSKGSNHEIVVIEGCRSDRVENQSTRNSGVIHAGIYYRSAIRPLKARLCVKGNRQLYDFCEEFEVPHARTGKLVVATCEEEEAGLEELQQIAQDNQVPGARIIDGVEAQQMEPGVRATRALHAPSSGVIDAAAYLDTLRRISRAHTLWGTRVVDISVVRGGFELQTLQGKRRERFVAKTLINAAGIHADELARLVNPESPYSIVPVRGEAAKFYSTRRPELAMRGMNVYPVPTSFTTAEGEVVDTLGIHLTPTLDAAGQVASTVSVGPAVTPGVEKEDYATSLHPPRYFWEQVHPFFPGLRVGDLELHQAGIQARLPNHPDWIIESDPKHPRFLNLIGIDSPGLTASLAIANYLSDELLANL
jgi:L-2-hydroxyglutarate oxidase LhgO